MKKLHEKYITKNKTSYRLDRQTKKGRRGGSFKTLNDAIVARQYLIDYNWEYPCGRKIYKYNDTYYLFKYVNRFVLEFKSSTINEIDNFIKENKDTTFIQHRGNKYIIIKSMKYTIYKRYILLLLIILYFLQNENSFCN